MPSHVFARTLTQGTLDLATGQGSQSSFTDSIQVITIAASFQSTETLVKNKALKLWSKTKHWNSGQKQSTETLVKKAVI